MFHGPPVIFSICMDIDVTYSVLSPAFMSFFLFGTNLQNTKVNQ